MEHKINSVFIPCYEHTNYTGLSSKICSAVLNRNTSISAYYTTPQRTQESQKHMEISSGGNVSSGSLSLITTLLQFLRYNPTPAEQMWFADKIHLHFNSYLNKQNKHIQVRHIQVVATHADACVATTWMSYQRVPCHPWCTHRTSLVVQKNFSVFLWLWTIPLRLVLWFSCYVCNQAEHYETPCILSIIVINGPSVYSSIQASQWDAST